MLKKIQKITAVLKKELIDSTVNDSVALSWFDLKKPYLTGVSKGGVEFVLKVKGVHLHEGAVLVSKEGYKIAVERDVDVIYQLDFEEIEDFAQVAYEVGNRHQPIAIKSMQIIFLEDIALQNIIKSAYSNPKIKIEKLKSYFKPTGKAHHTH